MTTGAVLDRAKSLFRSGSHIFESSVLPSPPMDASIWSSWRRCGRPVKILAKFTASLTMGVVLVFLSIAEHQPQTTYETAYGGDVSMALVKRNYKQTVSQQRIDDIRASLNISIPTAKHHSNNASTSQVVLVLQAPSDAAMLERFLYKDPNVFSLHEPLEEAEQRLAASLGVPDIYQFHNASFRALPPVFTHYTQKIILNIANCRLDHVVSSSLDPAAPFLTAHEFRMCTTTPIKKMEKCVEILRSACAQRRVRMMTTTRFLLHMAEDIIAQYPHTKFILLARDPRDIMLTRLQASPPPNLSIIAEARKLCVRMRHDLDNYVRFKMNYPQSVLLIKYEHVEQITRHTTTLVYHFLQQSMPPVVLSSLMERDPIGSNIIKADAGPSEEPGWKTKLTNEQIQVITRECLDYMSNSGYLVEL